MKGKKGSPKGTRKRRRLKPGELRTNLIILGAILGVSVAFFIVHLVWNSPQPSVSRTEVERSFPSEKTPSSAEIPHAPAEAPHDAVVPAEPSVAPVVSDTSAESVSSAQPQPQPRSEPAVLPSVAPAAPVAEKLVIPKIASEKAPVQKAPEEKTPAKSIAKNGTGNPAKPVVSEAAFSTARTAAPRPERPVPQKHRGTIIFVFDDAGHNLKQLEPFLKLPFPCTIAVLPGLQYSEEAARRTRAAGKEVILHQPMQATNPKMDPGPGAITKGMTQAQIRSLVRKNLAEIGPVVGLNNHEGSLITADRSAMIAVFDVVREKGIYFLDSRTNSKTVAPVLARESGMTIWERAVFLDNSQDRAAIIEAVNNGMKVADKKGTAIMIGHIWSNQLAGILNEMYPELVSQGFSLSTIAKIATDEDLSE